MGHIVQNWTVALQLRGGTIHRDRTSVAERGQMPKD